MTWIDLYKIKIKKKTQSINYICLNKVEYINYYYIPPTNLKGSYIFFNIYNQYKGKVKKYNKVMLYINMLFKDISLSIFSSKHLKWIK